MKNQKSNMLTSLMMALGLFVFTTPTTALAQPQTPAQPAPKQNIQSPGNQQAPQAPRTPNQTTPTQPGTGGAQRLEKTAKLKVTVIDGRTRQPLQGAEIVLGETEQRFRTDQKGETAWIDAPLIRDERYRPMIAQLHGQLTLITYKNGYRDTIYFNVRVHDNVESRVTVWMYKIAPGEDRRIEPLAYETPYHHLWLVELAEKFRSPTQPGEGPERP